MFEGGGDGNSKSKIWTEAATNKKGEFGGKFTISYQKIGRL